MLCKTSHYRARTANTNLQLQSTDKLNQNGCHASWHYSSMIWLNIVREQQLLNWEYHNRKCVHPKHCIISKLHSLLILYKGREVGQPNYVWEHKAVLMYSIIHKWLAYFLLDRLEQCFHRCGISRLLVPRHYCWWLAQQYQESLNKASPMTEWDLYLSIGWWNSGIISVYVHIASHNNIFLKKRHTTGKFSDRKQHSCNLHNIDSWRILHLVLVK